MRWLGVLFLLWTSQAACEGLQGPDLHRQWAWTALHVIDWGQTLHVAKNPDRFSERNTFLGDHPSEGRVNTYFVLTGALHWVASTRWFKPKARKIFQSVTIGTTSAAVANNWHVGVRVDF